MLNHCCIKNMSSRESPGGPVVRIQHFHCLGLGSSPGQGTKILNTARPPKQFFFNPEYLVVFSGRVCQNSLTHSIWFPCLQLTTIMLATMFPCLINIFLSLILLESSTAFNTSGHSFLLETYFSLEFYNPTLLFSLPLRHLHLSFH